MFALLSMALKVPKELVPGVVLPVHPTAGLCVCLDGLCTVFLLALLLRWWLLYYHLFLS